MKANKIKDEIFMAGDIKRVTGGPGGEVFLLNGTEKTAVLDCGMAFSAGILIENLERELKGRSLDYAILTHTHYDHVAGLTYLRERWPNLISIGSEYGKKILEKASARKVIHDLSQVAWKDYTGEEKCDILMEGLGIDLVVGDGDSISLGNRSIRVIETPGHTSCSLSFFMEPDSVVFHSETVGVYIEGGKIIPAILKSYKSTMESIEKCKNIKAKHIISPHYGQIPESEVEGYWQKAIDSANEIKDFVLSMKKKDLGQEEILAEYTKKFWRNTRKNQQPKDAFLLNAKNIIFVILDEFSDENHL